MQREPSTMPLNVGMCLDAPVVIRCLSDEPHLAETAGPAKLHRWEQPPSKTTSTVTVPAPAGGAAAACGPVFAPWKLKEPSRKEAALLDDDAAKRGPLSAAELHARRVGAAFAQRQRHRQFRTTLPYFVPPARDTTPASLAATVRYVPDDEDVQWCLHDGVPMAALARIITCLEVAYATELIGLFEAETAHGRTFSDARNVARCTSFERRQKSIARELGTGQIGAEARIRKIAGIDPCAVCAAPIASSVHVFGDAVECRHCSVLCHRRCVLLPASASATTAASAPSFNSTSFTDWCCDACECSAGMAVAPIAAGGAMSNASQSPQRKSVGKGSKPAPRFRDCELCGRLGTAGPFVRIAVAADAEEEEQAQCKFVHVACAVMAPRSLGVVHRASRTFRRSGDAQADNAAPARKLSQTGTGSASALLGRGQSTRDLGAWIGQSCAFCGVVAGRNDFMVVCGASGCSRWMHPSCAAENQATEARIPVSATAAAARSVTAFCTHHTIIRDMRNGAYAPPLDTHTAALSSIAERAADTDLLESIDTSSVSDRRYAATLQPGDRHLLARVSSFWRRRRERRRADSGSLCARVKADEVPLIDIVGRFEIVRRSDDGVFGMSSVLSLIPELQLVLSRLLEAGRWVPVMFTTQSIARFGLDAAHSVDPSVAVLNFGQEEADDDDEESQRRAGSAAEGDEHGKLRKKPRGKKKPQPPPSLGGRWPELPQGVGSAAALDTGAEQVVPALRRLADSLSLLCGAAENMKMRESAKSDAIDVAFEEFAAEGLLPDARRGTKSHRTENTL